MSLLRKKILNHWKEYQPALYAQLQKENRLEEEAAKSAEKITDLHYHLVVEKKMEYWAAWEIVQEQFFLPEEESSLTNEGQSGEANETSE